MSSASDIQSPSLAGATSCELTRAVGREGEGDGRARARGLFTVRRGKGLLARLLATLYRLPPAGERIETLLEVEPEGGGTRWRRSFGGHLLVTRQRPLGGGGEEDLLAERFQGVECRFRLDHEAPATVFRQIGAALCLGPFRLPLPKRVAPRVEAREEPGRGPGSTRISVKIFLPFGGILIAYHGEVKPLLSDTREENLL